MTTAAADAATTTEPTTTRRLVRLSSEGEPITDQDDATDAMGCLGWSTPAPTPVDPTDPRLEGRRLDRAHDGRQLHGVWEVTLPDHIEAYHAEAEREGAGYYQPSWTMSWGAAELIAWLVVTW